VARMVGNTPGATLPLHVLSLRATQANNITNLHWEVVVPNNSQSFTVQRSPNGRDFENVQTVAATAGQKNYSAQDPSAKSKDIYYRIKETDANDQVYYSNILRVGTDAKQQVSIYPNPARDFITLNGVAEKAGPVAVKIYDAKGQLVLSTSWPQAAGSFARRIETQALTKGVYWLSVSGAVNANAMRVMKQ
jgi:trimeric autotransporter adhesin